MRSKKLILNIACAGIIVVLILIRIFVNTPIFLEWQIQNTKQSLKYLVVQDEFGLQDLACSIYEEARTNDVLLSYSQYQSNFPAELEKRLSDYLDYCSIEFDDIYVGGQTINIYPKGACVFRCTVEYHRGVYAWVDLVYIPSLDKQEQEWYKGQSKGSEQINSAWYIAVLYGF